MGDDPDRLEELVPSRMDHIDELDDNSRTALQVAALHGNHENVKILLRARADIAIHDRDSNSLLHLAARSKSIETLQWLLHQEKLDVNGRNAVDDTPLHVLAKHVPPSFDT